MRDVQMKPADGTASEYRQSQVMPKLYKSANIYVGFEVHTAVGGYEKYYLLKHNST
jgi:hypothetical protein